MSVNLYLDYSDIVLHSLNFKLSPIMSGNDSGEVENTLQDVFNEKAGTVLSSIFAERRDYALT